MFSAYLIYQVTLSPGQVVIFNQEVTNIGQHYNPSTGVFTCEVPGYYMFDVHVMEQPNKYVYVGIRHNRQPLAVAFTSALRDWQLTSAYVSALLHKGDTVDVASVFTSDLYGSRHRFNMFSGHLVNPL